MLRAITKERNSTDSIPELPPIPILDFDTFEGIDDSNDDSINCEAIPIPLINKMLQFVPFGGDMFCFMLLLFDTGCRIVEIDRMFWRNVKGNWLYWTIGKNQTGMRRAWLCNKHLKVYKEYWDTHACVGDHLLGAKGESLANRWRKEVRQHMPEMQKQYINLNKTLMKDEYLYQAKSFRKTYCTLRYAYFLDQEKGDKVIALLKLQAEMRHSCKEMSYLHYVRDIKKIQADKYLGLKPYEILEKCKNIKLWDFV